MTAIPAPAAAARSPHAGWIQSPAWDLFWMFSSLWGAALLFVGWTLSPVMTFVALLLLAQRFISVLHSWSTTYMVLFSPLLAQERRTDRRRYVWTPLGIALASLALGLIVASTQRFPANGQLTWTLAPFALYILVFWIGHFWHFGNQDFGVLTLYRSKAGQGDPLERRVDKSYSVAMMYVIQPIVYLSVVTTTAFSEIVHTALPFWNDLAMAAAEAAVAAAVLLFVGISSYELSKPNRSIPKLLYLLVMLLHPVLLFTSVATKNETLALAYIFSYLWSHWLIAIGLVGRINTRFYQSHGSGRWAAVVQHATVLGFIAGLVFLLTERHQDYLLFSTDGFRYKQLLAAISPGEGIVIGLVLGFFLGEQLLHYYCDRCLFRFRREGVRKRVAPLLLGSPAAR